MASGALPADVAGARLAAVPTLAALLPAPMSTTYAPRAVLTSELLATLAPRREFVRARARPCGAGADPGSQGMSNVRCIRPGQAVR